MSSVQSNPSTPAHSAPGPVVRQPARSPDTPESHSSTRFPDPSASRAQHLAHRNRWVGWCLFLGGITGGMILGLWAFEGPMEAPERFADYAGLPRRLLRLGHIAAMALGLTNIFFGFELPNLRLPYWALVVASASMITGAVLMPVLLTLAAFSEPWKFLLPIPSTATLVAVALVCWGLRRPGRPA